MKGPCWYLLARAARLKPRAPLKKMIRVRSFRYLSYRELVRVTNITTVSDAGSGEIVF